MLVPSRRKGEGSGRASSSDNSGWEERTLRCRPQENRFLLLVTGRASLLREQTESKWCWVLGFALSLLDMHPKPGKFMEAQHVTGNGDFPIFSVSPGIFITCTSARPQDMVTVRGWCSQGRWGCLGPEGQLPPQGQCLMIVDRPQGAQTYTAVLSTRCKETHLGLYIFGTPSWREGQLGESRGQPACVRGAWGACLRANHREAQRA